MYIWSLGVTKMDSIVVASHITQCSDQQVYCLLWLEVWISINIYEYEQGMPQDSVHTNETNLKESMMEACMVYEVAERTELRS